MKKYLNIAALFVCLMGGSVHAQPLIIFSYEEMSCGAWAKSAQGHETVRAQYDAWVRGFISGSNWATPNHQIPFQGKDFSATISLYIDKYCRENPLKDMVGGTMELVEELVGDKN